MKKYQKIIDTIKKLSQEQVELKPQRKTVTFTGERKLEPNRAAYIVAANNSRLRHLHIAYQILRGKEPVYPKRKYVNESVVKFMVTQFTPREMQEAS